jgi:hypothetical protein
VRVTPTRGWRRSRSVGGGLDPRRAGHQAAEPIAAGATRVGHTRDEPPATVNLPVNWGAVTADAARATLVDLAARRVIELYQPGGDPRATLVRVTGTAVAVGAVQAIRRGEPHRPLPPGDRVVVRGQRYGHWARSISRR